MHKHVNVFAQIKIRHATTQTSTLMPNLVHANAQELNALILLKLTSTPKLVSVSALNQKKLVHMEKFGTHAIVNAFVLLKIVLLVLIGTHRDANVFVCHNFARI